MRSPHESRHLVLHALQPRSRANGPELRTCIWLQGCTLGCPGCFNPQTHTTDGGQRIAVDELVDRVMREAGDVDGITISGGEPMQQAPALVAFLESLRARSREHDGVSTLSVVLFSGYTLGEIRRQPQGGRVLSLADAVICGRYVERQRSARNLLGSSNQTIHLLSSRFRHDDFEQVPEAEIRIDPDGTLHLSGVEPPIELLSGR